MTLKTLAVAAVAAVAALLLGAAPASADPLPSGCEVHIDLVIGGVCIPTDLDG